MKKAMVVLLAVMLLPAAAVQAVEWKMASFDSLYGLGGGTLPYGGGFSYNANGDNVVVSGTAFYTAIGIDSYLGTQLVGGDGIDLEVQGNFAMYGLFKYSDPDGVLGWAMSNPDTLMAIEIRAREVGLDFEYDDGYDGGMDLEEHFTLDAKDIPGVSYLTATFGDIAQWGYTELTPGVWMDLALDETNHPGYAALSIVINGFSTDNWDAFIDPTGTANAYLLTGDLGGPIAGTTPGSGMRIAPIPAPGALLLGTIGAGCLGWLRRRRTV